MTYNKKQWDDYWAKHGKEVNERRRLKYLTNAKYRADALRRSHEQVERLRKQREEQRAKSTED